MSSSRHAGFGCSNSVRGLFAGGYATSTTIDYITIATTGSTTAFGDLSQGRHDGGAACDGNRGVFCGGVTGSRVDTIDYVAVATPATAVSFGSLASATSGCSGAASATRGLYGLSLIHI